MRYLALNSSQRSFSFKYPKLKNIRGARDLIKKNLIAFRLLV